MKNYLPSRLLKARALELLSLEGSEWPDTLNAEELARLWFPDDKHSRDSLEAAITRAIDAHELQAAGTRKSRMGFHFEGLRGVTFPTPGRKPEPAFTSASLMAWLGSDPAPYLVRAWHDEAGQNAAPAAKVGAGETVTEAKETPRTNKKIWDDDKLLTLWNESLQPGATQASLAKKYGVAPQRISALLKKAKEKFSASGKSKSLIPAVGRPVTFGK